jgi:hypothetical protein
MVPVGTIFFAGVTGDAFREHPGIFSSEETLPLLLGRLKIHLDVRTSYQAIMGITGLTYFF